MRSLTLPPDFPLPGLERAVADRDTMHLGSGAHYLAVGLEALRLVEDALGGGPAPRRILDLPCGHGRVTRFLRARFPRAGITVSDLDADGVHFAATRFRAHGVHSDGGFRGLRLDGPYDLVWIGSLVTHLPAIETRRLLDLVVRNLSPRGVVVLTSHGAHVAARMAAGERYGLTPAAAGAVLRDHAAEGYGYHDYAGSRCYGVSLVSRAWFAASLQGSPLRLDAYRERAWDGHQDVVVLRPAAARSPLLRLFPLPWQRERDAFAAPGWFEAAEPCGDVPPGAEEAGGTAPAPPAAPEGFDEAWYRAHHAEISAAVARGDFASGLDHYLRYGGGEGRAFSAASGGWTEREPADDAPRVRTQDADA